MFTHFSGVALQLKFDIRVTILKSHKKLIPQLAIKLHAVWNWQ